ncbi:hypothetical protein HK097_003183 [Rhizophlyctis rosea]|uniref:Uncharacterized protein n=1 Tax=Rhizophlyctis rosea TaxID=64517 RepID=A0AAD5WZR1_9FUNG|nr:hypothetical protein HK097_003183 [Rhizophlyctis rosea]
MTEDERVEIGELGVVDKLLEGLQRGGSDDGFLGVSSGAKELIGANTDTELMMQEIQKTDEPIVAERKEDGKRRKQADMRLAGCSDTRSRLDNKDQPPTRMEARQHAHMHHKNIEMVLDLYDSKNLTKPQTKILIHHSSQSLSAAICVDAALHEVAVGVDDLLGTILMVAHWDGKTEHESSDVEEVEDAVVAKALAALLEKAARVGKRQEKGRSVGTSSGQVEGD